MSATKAVPQRNVIVYPGMGALSAWGDHALSGAYNPYSGVEVVADSAYTNWRDVYATMDLVTDGGSNALHVSEHTNFSPAQFANAAQFWTRAGQQWSVGFRWKRVTAETNRKRIRAGFKAATLQSIPGGIEVWGPWQSIASQYGTAGYSWTFTLPDWWYNQDGDPSIGGILNDVGTLFCIEMESWSGGPYYPNYNGVDPHTSSQFSQFDFQIYIYAGITVHWTGAYVQPDTPTAPLDPVPPTSNPTPTPTPTVDPTTLTVSCTGCGPSDCKSYSGEVIADSSGKCLGDFCTADAWGRALGFTVSGGRPWPIPPPGPIDFTAGLFNTLNLIGSAYWEPPEPDPTTGSVSFPQPNIGVNDFYDGALGGVIVEDATGPRGLEHLPALEVDGAGQGSFHIGFVGDQVSRLSASDPISDLAYAWHPAIGSRWVTSGWVRSVADDDGIDVVGSTLQFGYLSPTLNVQLLGFAPLQSDWNYFEYHFTFRPLFLPQGNGFAIPVWGASGPGLYNYITKDITFYPGSIYETHISFTKWARRGRLHFKCLHLYPEGAEALVGGGVYLDGIKFRRAGL